jgi:hypothetical protein
MTGYVCETGQSGRKNRMSKLRSSVGNRGLEKSFEGWRVRPWGREPSCEVTVAVGGKQGCE